MTIEEIDEILVDQGYPSCDQLASLPLGKQLKELDSFAWTSTNRTLELYAKDDIRSNLGSDEQDLPIEELEERLREQGRLIKEEKLTEVYRKHIKYVIEATVNLTTDDYKKLARIKDSSWTFEEPFLSYAKLLYSGSNPTGPFGPLDSYLRKFLRFVALYHDIGKVIHKDRHGILGRHLLESFEENETRELRKILRKDGEDYYPLMLELISHHDLFGTLCTGEASRPVLLEALRDKDPEIALGCHVTINLADIYSTLKTKNLTLDERIFKTLLEDWKFIVDLVERQKKREPELYRSNLERSLLFYVQQPEYASDRIRRLLVSTIYMIKEIKQLWGIDEYETDNMVNTLSEKVETSEQITQEELKELADRVARQENKQTLKSLANIITGGKQVSSKKLEEAIDKIKRDRYVSQEELRVLADKITIDVILDALRKRLGPGLVVFCDCFALICKFDYTLRFVSALVTGWINEKVKNERKCGHSTEPKEIFNIIDVRELVAIFVDVFARLVDNYQDLTFQKEKWQRRVGIELLGVTRSNRISERIIELLLGNRCIEGVNWIADEATAWYFV